MQRISKACQRFGVKAEEDGFLFVLIRNNFRFHLSAEEAELQVKLISTRGNKEIEFGEFKGGTWLMKCGLFFAHVFVFKLGG